VIPLVRVDNRLLHGQILETWIPRLGIEEVVVGDDEAAGSDLARAAMTLCVQSPCRVLVLLRDVAALAAAREGGLTPALAPKVNLGNVHFGPGRRPVTPSVFLAAPELEALRDLAAAGFELEARAIPSEAPAGLADIERRYEASP